MTRNEKRAAIIDALDSSEARCPTFYKGLTAADYLCDGLDGCQRCLERAADAVIKIIEGEKP